MSDQEIDQLKQRAEKAEAACEEMRDSLLWALTQLDRRIEQHEDGSAFVRGTRTEIVGYMLHYVKARAALLNLGWETDCGKDFVPRVELEKAQAACAETARQLKNANKVGLMLAADRSLLRGTLLRIAEGKQLPDSKDSNGLSAGEISVGDLRRVFRALEETK